MVDFYNAWFSISHFILLLLIPALTMNSFAGDIKNKTIKNILSSPIKSHNVVLGKFLGCFIVMITAVFSFLDLSSFFLFFIRM